MAKPLVTIVTPTYNQAAFLRATIDSVLAQDYPNIEYIVLDDGSTDQTREILASYGTRLTWSSRENRGQTPTINEGWAKAHGEIATWLNSDDTLYADAVTKVVDYLEDHTDVSIVFGDTMFTDAVGTPLQRTTAEAFRYELFVVACENPIAQPSAFLRRNVLDDIGPLDPRYYYFMDWDYWLRAGMRHRIAYFPELLSTYRLHPESKTVAKTAQVADELRYMYETFFSRPDLPPQLRRLRRRAMANMWFTMGGYYVRGGRGGAAFRASLHAIAADPTLVTDRRMVHKLFYCTLGSGRLYARVRDLYRGGAPAGADRSLGT